MSEAEAAAYHHVFDEPESDAVVLTWPRTIPMREGDRGWADMAAIERRLPELAGVPTVAAVGARRQRVPDRVRRAAQGAAAARRGSDHVRSRRALPAGRSRSRPGQGHGRVPRSGRSVGAARFAGTQNAWISSSPTAEELALLRADPLLWEQELDVRPEVAVDLERAVGRRAGEVFWRSASRPSLLARARRSRPRPPEHGEGERLVGPLRAAAAGARDRRRSRRPVPLGGRRRASSLDPEDVRRVFQFAGTPARLARREACCARRRSDSPRCPASRGTPRYVEIEGLRMAYVEAGVAANGTPRDECFLLLHGEPTWGYLYRHMIPALAAVGRVVVPDLIGFGRSDKPALPQAYSYRSHARWLHRFVESLDLTRSDAGVPGLGRPARPARPGARARALPPRGADEHRVSAAASRCPRRSSPGGAGRRRSPSSTCRR